MIEKTCGIVLAVTPVSETSRVVTWLTPDHGKAFTMVKGSQRPKSLFLGQYDLFYTCELLFYARPRTGLHIARECTPLQTRRRFREDWKSCATASYLASLATAATHRDTPSPAVYRFLEHALDDLCRSGTNPGILHWNELALLALLGITPRLRHCATCHRDIRPNGKSLQFSDRAGGVICGHCTGPSHHGVSIRPDILAILTAWQAATSADAARTVRCTTRQEDTASRMLGSFMQFHMDMELRARAMALDIVRQPAPRKKALSL